MKIAKKTNPQFPFPRFPIWPGIGEGIPDSRFGRNRESGSKSPVSRFGRESGIGVPTSMAANREIGDTPLCEYIMNARSWAGCCLQSFTGKCRFRPPPTLLNCLNCQDRPMEDDVIVERPLQF